jgi:hypothetical protein
MSGSVAFIGGNRAASGNSSTLPIGIGVGTLVLLLAFALLGDMTDGTEISSDTEDEATTSSEMRFGTACVDQTMTFVDTRSMEGINSLSRSLFNADAQEGTMFSPF